jgi:hypothetical protein
MHIASRSRKRSLAAEKGKFLHPELFGHRGELAIGDQRHPAPIHPNE